MVLRCRRRFPASSALRSVKPASSKFSTATSHAPKDVRVAEQDHTLVARPVDNLADLPNQLLGFKATLNLRAGVAAVGLHVEGHHHEAACLAQNFSAGRELHRVRTAVPKPIVADSGTRRWVHGCRPARGGRRSRARRRAARRRRRDGSPRSCTPTGCSVCSCR